EEAITNYQRALALRADFAAARDKLHRAVQRKLAAQGEGQAAQESPKPPVVSPHDSQLAKAACREGIALTGQGRFDEARIQFEQAARLQPDDAHIHNNLGSLLVHQRRYEEAIEEYQQAVRLKPAFTE